MGPESAHRPQAAGRVVRMFDFEERADPSRPDFNPEPVPRHWIRAQHLPPERERPGFPLVNKAEYDLTVAHQGICSVRLPTSGGSTALRLSGGLIPVFPRVDYAVTAFVRTQPLRHARAFVSAVLLDERGEPLAGSLRRSPPIDSPSEWTRVEVQLPGTYSNAAFVQLELLLLQPEHFEPAPLSQPHSVWAQDLSGAAWFDDISVVQLPRVEILTDAPAGVLVGDRKLVITADVRDLTGEDMTAELTIRGLDDGVVASQSRRLGPGGGRLDWAPKLPAYGWYEISLQVANQTGVVGSALTRLIWAPPAVEVGESVRRSRPRFGIRLSGDDRRVLPLTPDLLRAGGAGAVTIQLPPVGSAGVSLPERLAELKGPIDRMLGERLDVTLGIERVDEELALGLRIDPGDPVALFEQEPAKWMAPTRALFDLFGQRVQRWRMGGEAAMGTLLAPELPARLAAMRKSLARAIPGPLISIPSRADWPWPLAAKGPRAAIDGVAMALPPGFGPQAISEIARQWTSQRGPSLEFTVAIESFPPEQFGRPVAVAELVKRSALVWESLDPWSSDSVRKTGLEISQPWAAGPSDRNPVHPEPALGVWRTLSEHLGPRRAAGRLPAPDQVTCMVLVDSAAGPDGRRSGALLAWTDNQSPTTLTAQLGRGPLVAIDPFGNARELPPGRNGLYTIPVGPTPVFIEGIDAEVALFVQGLRVEPAFINSVAAEHEAEIVLSNPWPTRVTGEVQLTPPATSVVRQSWRFSPTAPIPFSILPGGKTRLPVTFSFSPAEESGPAKIGAIVRFSSGLAGQGGPLSLTAPVTIGLPDLDLSASLVLSPTLSGPDVVVSVNVNNTGAQSRTLVLDAVGFGEATQSQPVSNLLPGEMIVRRFVFRDAAARLAGRRIRVSVSDAEGPERLNRFVVVPALER